MVKWAYVLVFELDDDIDEDFVKELDEELFEKVREVAEKRGIPFQLELVPYVIAEFAFPKLKERGGGE